MQILLALWDCSENREAVTKLLDYIHVDLISEFAINNEMMLTMTGDAKVLPYFTGSLGVNSTHPCVFCDLKVEKGRRENRQQYLKTSWETYLTKHSDRTICHAPSPILTGMENLGYSSFEQFITAPSLHGLLSADRFIQIALDPKRLKQNEVFRKPSYCR